MPGAVLEGPKWSSSTITWSFAQTTYAQDASLAFSAPVAAQYQSAIEAALQTWSQVSGITFVQVPDSSNPAQAADIRIGFGNLNYAQTSQIGETDYLANANGTAFLPDTIVRLEDPSLVPINGAGDYSGTQASLYQVALHEIGHAIGFAVDQDPNSIEYLTLSANNATLDATDIAAVQSLYGPPAGGIAVTPPSTTTASNTTASTAASTAASTPAIANVVATTTTANAVASTPGEINLQGMAGQYTIAATPDGELYVQDNVADRDGTQTLSGVTEMAFSNGTGIFDPSGNAETVAHLYQAAFGRAPDASGLLYWTNALDSGAANATQVAAGFVGSSEFANAYASMDDSQFVTQLYQNVLGRAPDAGGEAYWVTAMQNGASQAQVLMGLAESPENLANTIATTGDADQAEAYRLYQAALDRTPDASGLSAWTSMLQAGATPGAVAAGFMATPEYQNLYGGTDNTGFVTDLYQNVLHRAPDAAGAQYWVNALQNGMSRADVLVGFSDNTENRINTAGATHANWVFLPAS